MAYKFFNKEDYNLGFNLGFVVGVITTLSIIGLIISIIKY